MAAFRHILITGASSGIGAALARHYASGGMRLSLGGRDIARLDAVAADCTARGAEVMTAAVDVTDRGAMRHWVLAADTAQPLDSVIANAGVGGMHEGEAQARAILAVNLEGVLNTAYPALERMAERGRGQLALMSSLAGYRGLPDAPAYSASKAAVTALGEAWRGAHAAAGIKVSVICPGFIATPMTSGKRFPKPFLMGAERAAAIIVRGLAADRAHIDFPWQLALGSWILTLLPSRLSDRILRPRRRG
ncbi:MAG TPA: SDR family NAD(P)-dependent oxidoreductase [Stellaceae bacterium]|nr:SDR family NAD(P)-dependent oxidoreductase [Stellaceae bacterium]